MSAQYAAQHSGSADSVHLTEHTQPAAVARMKWGHKDGQIALGAMCRASSQASSMGGHDADGDRQKARPRDGLPVRMLLNSDRYE